MVFNEVLLVRVKQHSFHLYVIKPVADVWLYPPATLESVLPFPRSTMQVFKVESHQKHEDEYQ